MIRTIYNLLFLLQTSFIFFTEFGLYFFTRNYDSFIMRITKRLASSNILYVKVFQSFALNNSIMNDKMNNELLKFTDNAPYTNEDIDYDTLLQLSMDYDIVFNHEFDKPMNSGMISLVYSATLNNSNTNNHNNIVIKIKRKNIDKKLEIGIDNLLFLINLLKYIPFLRNYNITRLIEDNIETIKQQTDFSNEIANIKRMQRNCINLDYVKIPYVYETINNDYNNVIAMSYINGKKFNEIEKDDYLEFAKQVIKFGIVTSFIHGFSHGDFHIGNILFIKEDEEKYKLGIIDFGIMSEIKEPFKSNLLSCLMSVFQESPIIFLNKFINSGIFEPSLIKDILPQNVYDNFIQVNLQLLEKYLYSKRVDQILLYEFIHIFFAFINNTNNTNTNNTNKNIYNLSKYGILPSDNFIKLQLSLAMSNGVTFALCQDKTFQLMNDVVNELFHTKLFMME